MRVIKSMILGLAIGTIMGIVMFPELDRRTQRNIKEQRKEPCVWLMIHMTILWVI